MSNTTAPDGRPLACDEAQLELSADMDRLPGEPPGPTAAAADLHRQNCVTCQTFVNRASQVRRELRITGSSDTVDVTDRVLAAIGTGGQYVPSRRQRRVWLMATAAASIVVVAAVAAAWLTDRAAIPTETAPADASLADPSLDSRGHQVVDASRRAAVWTPDSLDPAIVDNLSELDTVGRITIVRRGSVGLTGSQPTSTSAVGGLEPGWVVPTDVIAIDRETYGPFFPEVVSPESTGPLAVLGSGAAGRMGLEPGSTLNFARGSVTVTAVVDDRLIGGAELAVDRTTGETLGVIIPRYAVVEYVGADRLPEADAATLHADLVGLPEPTDRPFRVVVESDGAILRNNDSVLPTGQVKVLLGEFAFDLETEQLTVDPTWFDANVITTNVDPLGSVTCHRLVADALVAALSELEADGNLDVIDGERFQGCFNPRFVRTTGEPSRHSWGGAVDFGTADDRPDPELVAAMERNGFVWGGSWLIPDLGHFEYVGDRR